VSAEEIGEPIAVVGMACRYPDADGPWQLWDLVLRSRRAFRRLPRQRLDLADYWHPDPANPDTTYGTRAAVLDGWRFDRAAFRVPGEVFRATDPAHWLALETAALALADAGFADGAGLDPDRVGVVVGNSLTGDVSRSQALRLRWPYVRRILESTLPEPGSDAVIAEIARRYLAPFPPVGDATLAGGLANTIAGRICNHFDFHGGGYTVDGACASSMLAVITLCRALRDRSVDFAVAGGVDLSLDPFELVGFAKTGALATDDMLVYDEHSAGFWPGEGCGMLALMRAEDARVAGIPCYTEILGWGVSSDGSGGITRPEVAGQALALRRAGGMAGIEHADVGLYEGHGTGTAVGDLVELTALNAVRVGAATSAALGSVKANIGHTKAAAGVAGVIKAALSVAGAVLPPTTGCRSPHPALGDTLRVLAEPEPWPAGPRLAGVSAMGFGGINTHLVLGGPAGHRSGRSVPRIEIGQPDPPVEMIALSGRDTAQLTRLLRRIADRAAEMSLAELHDLACHFGRLTPGGAVRAAFTVRTQEDLAGRAGMAADRLGDVARGGLVTAPGLWLGNDVAGRITLLFPGQGVLGDQDADTARAQPTIYRACLAAIDWLDRLGVTPTAAIGHSLGEIAALVWSGRLSREDGARLVAERGRIMAEHGEADTGMLGVATDPAGAVRLCAGTGLVVAADNAARAQVLAGRRDELRAVALRAAERGIRTTMLPVSHGFHSPAMAGCVAPLRAILDTLTMRPASRTVISTVYGRMLGEGDDPREMLARQLLVPVLFRPAVRCVAGGTDLFCAVGPTLAGLVEQAPAVSLDVHRSAPAAAALFAASAVKDVGPLFAGRSARPFELWRDPEFLANPCSVDPSIVIESLAAPRELTTRDTASTVIGFLAGAVELDPELIRPDARLIGELGLSSLRVTQLVVDAARVLGHQAPAAALAVADLTVADVIAVIDTLPEAVGDTGGEAIPGVRPWLDCFTETLVPVADAGPWRPTESVYLPDAEDVDALLAAGRMALRAKALVVITHSAALGGFLRSLHREHPEVGITLVRTPPGQADPAGCHAEPGRWRERVLGVDGVLCEPVERPLLASAAAGELPVTADDVVLVSGGGRGIGYACARSLALASGVALAVIGRTHPGDDPHLRANLDSLRGEGIRVGYRAADIARPDAVRAAAAGLESELGPVTGVLHASGVNEPASFDRADADLVRRHLRPKVDGLRAMMAALPADRLRLVVTFGSMIGRIGLAGEAHYALANGALRAEAERLATRLPDCRVLHVDWSVWSGTGMGERLGVLRTLESSGIVPIPVADGTELLLRMLRTPADTAVAVHGRLGDPDVADTDGRFVRRLRVYQPGVEAVSDTVLSLPTDPYLADHRLDGVLVLPGVVGLEAMAQVASALVGRPLTIAERVTFDRPVTVPDTGETRIRVCALRRGDVVVTVLRCAETAFGIDHFRAEFPLAGVRSIGDPELVAGGGSVGAEDLYGPVFFHTGRFQRVSVVSLPGPRACRATVTEDAGEPWFVPVLGPLAVNDASVHVLQCCVPHRRLLPVGCDRVEFTPCASGPVALHGIERQAGGGDYTWDVAGLDTAARPVIRWTGLRLRDVGPLAHDRSWPPALLAVLLERGAHGVGLDRSLRVRVTEPFAVDVSADCVAGCAWEAVGVSGHTADAELTGLLARPCAEAPERLAARATAMSRCLVRPAAGWAFAGAYDGGWVVVRSGDTLVASLVVTVTGLPDPVVIALSTAVVGE
jgi:enediyne polyketide synthase